MEIHPLTFYFGKTIDFLNLTLESIRFQILQMQMEEDQT